MKRRNFSRDFMGWMGMGALATSLPVAIAACTPKSDSDADSATTPAESTAPKDAKDAAFIPLGTTAELAQQGYLSSADALSEPLIVIPDPNTPNGVLALSSTCPHNGCTIAWQEDLFACPCHGSKFNPDGSIVVGPAQEALSQFTAKIEGDSVLVSGVKA